MASDLLPGRSVRLRFRNPRYDKIIRINTETISRKMGFTDDQVFDIILAVEEAYANAIEHSGKNRGDIELEIIYHLYPDRLEVSVHDSGCGFDEAVTLREIRDAESDIALDRGRGLGLIRNLADKAEISSALGAGTLIKIIKFLPVKPPKTVPA